MGAGRVTGLVAGLLMLGGCAGGTAAPDSAGPATSSAPTMSSAAVTAVPSKLQVTVPGLGGPVVDPTGGPASAEGGSVSEVPESIVPSDLPPVVPEPGAEVPTTDPEDGVASEASPAAPTAPADPAAVEVQLVGCEDCLVLGTHANVVGGYSAALVSQGGRAAVISVDPAGALVAIQAVPYGVTFAAQPGGRLACGAGGRCLVLATQADGRAVLSAFGLGADGRWTDLSGSDGFVSATDKAVPVMLEDALGAAVQVTDGTTTIWNVLAWNGSEFATLGCGPDGDTPDLAALDLAACLS